MGKAFAAIVMMLFSLACQAQDPSARLFVINKGKQGSGKHHISLKWYSNRLYYPEGVFLYRKESQETDWKKLTPSLLKKLPVPKSNFQDPVLSRLREEMKADSSLQVAVEIASSSPLAKIKDIAWLLCMVKSFESEAYSRFLGIQFNDTTVEEGKAYQYKVTHPFSGTEALLAKSNTIVCGQESKEAPPSMFTADLFRKSVGIKWQEEPNRFFGVNIYRKKSPDTSFSLLNKEPIMAVSTRDKTGKTKLADYFWTDEKIQEQVSYHYKLVALDFFGRESNPSKIIEISIPDKTPPITPSSFVFRIDNDKAIFNWKYFPEPDAKCVRLFRSNKVTGPYTRMAEMTPDQQQYTDSNLKPGGYYYQLASVDKSENESRTGAVFVEMRDITPPAIPQGLLLSADTGKISLRWNANKDPDLLGYRLFRSATGKKNSFVLIHSEPIKEPKFQDPFPSNRKGAYYYFLRSVDTSYNLSKESDTLKAVLPDKTSPKAPYVKSVVPSENGMSIEWLPNVENDLLGYRLFRFVQGDSAATVWVSALFPRVTTSFEDKLDEHKDYCYQLKAIDSSQNASPSSKPFCSRKNGKASTTLHMPQLNIHYDKKKKTAQVSWEWKSAAKTRGFVLYKKEKGSKVFRPVTGMTAEKKWEEKKPIEGAIYQVRAYLQSGEVLVSEPKETRR